MSMEGTEAIAEWNACLRLLEAGLISGSLEGEGLARVRITNRGQAVFEAPAE
jgi:hypothetical protein